MWVAPGYNIRRTEAQTKRPVDENVAIVAASEVGQHLAEKFRQELSGTRTVGIFDERRSRFVESGNRYESTSTPDTL
jgi:hypothetical protein